MWVPVVPGKYKNYNHERNYYIYYNYERYMKITQLGEFEELVLLTVATLGEDAYGVEIKRELEERLKKKVSVGSIQTSLKRLEEKGFLKSEFGEATQKRGGKRKRIYTTTTYAHKVLAEIRQVRSDLWKSLPKYIQNLKPG